MEEEGEGTAIEVESFPALNPSSKAHNRRSYGKRRSRGPLKTEEVKSLFDFSHLSSKAKMRKRKYERANLSSGSEDEVEILPPPIVSTEPIDPRHGPIENSPLGVKTTRSRKRGLVIPEVEEKRKVSSESRAEIVKLEMKMKCLKEARRGEQYVIPESDSEIEIISESDQEAEESDIGVESDDGVPGGFEISFKSAKHQKTFFVSKSSMISGLVTAFESEFGCKVIGVSFDGDAVDVTQSIGGLDDLEEGDQIDVKIQ